MRAMLFFRQNRRLIAWLACLAMLLSAFAPAISHAMANQGGATLLMEICSATGDKPGLAIKLDLPTPADSKDSKTAPMQHCPYCLTHAGSFALLATVPPALLTPNLSYTLPPLFYHAPRPLFAWATSHPRAPPTAS